MNVVDANNERTRRKQAKRLRMMEEVPVDPGAFIDWECYLNWLGLDGGG